MDPITVVNFFLAFVIFILGLAVYYKKKDTMTLYIGIAFGLYAVSHLVLILSLEGMTDTLIVIRILAYLIVAFVLYKRLRS